MKEMSNNPESNTVDLIRTSEWILSEGGQKQAATNFSGINNNYQTWSAGINGFDFNKLQIPSSSTSSKLDPNSKPFAPRQPALSFPTKTLDENENNIRLNDEDKLRQIWADSIDDQSKQANPVPIQNLPRPVASPPRFASDICFRNYDQDFYRASLQEMATDDYGLRSLLRNIHISASTLKSDTSSVMNREALGFNETVRRHFVNPAYTYMESPFSNAIAGPLTESNQVPEEYLHGLGRSQSLPKIEFKRLPTDLLFFLFYTFVGDLMQIAVGAELYNRGWRLNKSTGLWVARLPNTNPDVRQKTFEKGLYQYFNPISWTRETERMTLVYSELAECQPNLAGSGAGSPPSAMATPTINGFNEEMLIRAIAKKRRESEIQQRMKLLAGSDNLPRFF